MAPLQPWVAVQTLQVLVAGSQTGAAPEQVWVQTPASTSPPPPPPVALPPPVPPAPPPVPPPGTAHLPVSGLQTSPGPQLTDSQGSVEAVGPHWQPNQAETKKEATKRRSFMAGDIAGHRAAVSPASPFSRARGAP